MAAGAFFFATTGTFITFGRFGCAIAVTVENDLLAGVTDLTEAVGCAGALAGDVRAGMVAGEMFGFTGTVAPTEFMPVGASRIMPGCRSLSLEFGNGRSVTSDAGSAAVVVDLAVEVEVTLELDLVLLLDLTVVTDPEPPADLALRVGLALVSAAFAANPDKAKPHTISMADVRNRFI